MFEKLERLVTLHVTFTTDGNLSINTGKGDGIRDNLVIREGGPNSNPVLSGSSLKGMVRSTIEGILCQAGEDVCVPDTCVPEPPKDQPEKDKHDNLPPGRQWLSSECGQGNRPICRVCQMFGNQHQAGRVNFHDARVRNGDQRVVTLSRTHVAITRDTRTAAGGALLTLETVPSGATFTGTIVLTNPGNGMVGAVLATLDLLPKIGLGAKKTSGYGKLDVQVTCLEHDYPAGNRPDPEPTQEEYQKIYREAWENLLKEIREECSGEGRPATEAQRHGEDTGPGTREPSSSPAP